MASAPWYLNNDRPSLKHQKNWKEGVTDTKVWYDRGAKVFQATKYRKGACENCGSMAHKTKDCLERPRTKGARWTGKSIAADEKVQDIQLAGFDAKRDRWNGYSNDEWVKEAERFEKVAELRAEIRRKELIDQTDGDEELAVDADLEEEEDKVDETDNAGFAKVEKAVRTVGGGSTGTVRNLRIREDTAKYLLNLDLDSAYYDPKSRSMRQDPNPDKDPSQKTFAGDNFVRQSGAVAGFSSLNAFSVTAYERGQDVHLQATPSQAEAAFQQFRTRKEALGQSSKADMLAKYGNAAAPLTEDVAALRGSEAYVEYDASGRLLRGHEVVALSKYEEDIHPGNHTSVWGSYWKDGQWGYACCHQFVKNSYCTGKVGETAAMEAAEQLHRNMQNKVQELEAREPTSRPEGTQPNQMALWGTETEEGVQLDDAKLKAAIQKQERLEREALEQDGRKRGYNSLSADGLEVTAEDMEAYRLKRARDDDPLAAITKAKAGPAADGYDLV
ncbi:Pre-mRNA-splicing factor SLU7 [Auxenochlorella protothecoides]|uniref:Pre-mRNA-splicing factor SLU7 n=1 Tax=Auxenochlorella protothecoides TaxID=3075 RepID=A0A087SPB1_AUXPR|nr:Pre-mRNA-splicing factor SLU7 [Auxenochlorella protothecoides]KFM27565.1 Pre-mRNA-splicing factor SLU7 [Auxenochlorella protothecoides]RMZ56965.1 hypothetical protein APUTEX25_005027 [Auxenochlorella protothecoides]|eukprot:RMZ56965.1 hypothetical protein APUTEX25_005027 [Auxenochlorella protothecoides]